jgi:hypothetical protein
MSERQTTVSRSVEYETAQCSHCNDEIFIDNEKENVDRLPEGIPLVIGGGEHISVDRTDRSSLSKNHWAPKIIIKWFTGDGQSTDLTEQYLCRPCAESLYGE